MTGSSREIAEDRATGVAAFRTWWASRPSSLADVGMDRALVIFRAGWLAHFAQLRAIGGAFVFGRRALDPIDTQMVLTRADARRALRILRWSAVNLRCPQRLADNAAALLAAYGPCDEWRPTGADEPDYPDCARCGWAQEDHTNGNR